MEDNFGIGQYSISVNQEAFGQFFSAQLFMEAGIALGILLLLWIIILIIRKILHKSGYVPYEYEKIILQVMLPKVSSKSEEKSSEKNLQQIQEEISVTETIFGSLGGLKPARGFKNYFFGRKDDFSFEIVLKNQKIYFYVAVPRYVASYLEEQIHGQYPEAHIEEVADYNIFTPQSMVLGSYLLTTSEPVYPLKTYKKLENDPLNAVLNTFTKFGKDEGAAIQIQMRSAPGIWRKWSAKTVTKMHQGLSLKQAVKEAHPRIIKQIFNLFKSLFKSSKKNNEGSPQDIYKPSQMEEDAAKAMEEKASKAGLEVNIRTVVSAATVEKAQMRLNDINNSFAQFNIYEYGNSFRAKLVGRLKHLIKDFIHRQFNEKTKLILNTEELASLFHFPLSFTDVPNIDWLSAKKSSAPINIPAEGLLLGYNVYRGRHTEIHIREEDRRRHMYVIGMTGTGKSWFIEGLAIQDILAGKGICFIDPHGDAIDHILEYIPKERAEDVILFDPALVERPLGLNMLEYETQEQKLFVIDTILQVFDKLYDLKATGGPMFEQYMRNSLLLIMDDPETGMTLAEVSKVLADEDYRRLKLSRSKTQVVKDFWEKEAQKAGGEASLQNMVPYITSKLTPFIANDLIRPIISQQKSSFRFREAMDKQKIILVKLSKGKIGDLNANLLGMIMINKILMAALSRADLPESQRKDFYLYIDEFQNFLTDSIEIILSEARKYHLCLVIAHQYLGQLVKNNDTRFKDAIFGNVGTKTAFRIGVDDAESLAKEFAPVFTEYDFLNCPKYNCFMKLLIDNANPPPFNMATYPFSHFGAANAERGKAISELAILKYGRDRGVVEAELRQRKIMVEQLMTE